MEVLQRTLHERVYIPIDPWQAPPAPVASEGALRALGAPPVLCLLARTIRVGVTKTLHL
jgi:hypothetical protein